MTSTNLDTIIKMAKMIKPEVSIAGLLMIVDDAYLLALTQWANELPEPSRKKRLIEIVRHLTGRTDAELIAFCVKFVLEINDGDLTFGGEFRTLTKDPTLVIAALKFIKSVSQYRFNKVVQLLMKVCIEEGYNLKAIDSCFELVFGSDCIGQVSAVLRTYNVPNPLTWSSETAIYGLGM